MSTPSALSQAARDETAEDARTTPRAVPRPGETEAQAAARSARASQDDPARRAWGDGEDQPDHDGHEVYEQEDEPPGQ